MAPVTYARVLRPSGLRFVSLLRNAIEISKGPEQD
jgi:hypothetical protein